MGRLRRRGPATPDPMRRKIGTIMYSNNARLAPPRAYSPARMVTSLHCHRIGFFVECLLQDRLRNLTDRPVAPKGEAP